jgi:hypothetical protein
MEKNLDQRMVKRSRKRLIISGKYFELYEYEKPIFWNFPPNKLAESVGNKKKERRVDSIIRTQNNIRRICNANEDWGERLKFITFTFEENIQDVALANEFWKKFNRGLRKRFPGTKYIVVVEFQKRGAIHYHAVFFNMPFVYGLQNELVKLFPWGFIDVKCIHHVRNTGAYISKYLTKETLDNRLYKRKGYFCSRGVRKPVLIREMDSIGSIVNENFMVEFNNSFKSDMYGKITIKKGTIK